MRTYYENVISRHCKYKGAFLEEFCGRFFLLFLWGFVRDLGMRVIWYSESCGRKEESDRDKIRRRNMNSCWSCRCINVFKR